MHIPELKEHALPSNKLQFFKFAHERHKIYLKKSSGAPAPWTSDHILQHYKFTNVYRELDRTTVWFRENVRSKVTSPAEQLLAAVVFRWFNRIATGEAIFSQLDTNKTTAWDRLLVTGNADCLLEPIKTYCGKGPYVTGAYIIKTPDNLTKTEGVIQCIKWFMENEFFFTPEHHEGYRKVAERLAAERGIHTLESVWRWLRKFPYLGDFMAYEIVTDLRHTPLLDKAPDIMLWANPGPGAARGLSRIFEDDPSAYSQNNKIKLNRLMRNLLEASLTVWPEEWPALEMRDIEHTLCEYDKYMRVARGEGRPRSLYNGKA